ncbi:uncharacterized protein B0H18DRAFT_1163231, partial [Fomitopsis serialis]|uniref:uncharacterized protein n=1 Tax=Fomitopsis serialis TaxID=139415 RepID=UPI00200824A5
YRSFQNFFIRQHKQGSRLIAAEGDDTAAEGNDTAAEGNDTVAADTRVVGFESVSETTRLWIKGKDFTIGNLITDNVAARIWDDGAVVSYRLSPQEYHRYHCAVSGTVRCDYYSVDPVALRSAFNVLRPNARCTAGCVDSPSSVPSSSSRPAPRRSVRSSLTSRS